MMELKLSDVTFDEPLVKGGRSARTPTDLAGKLLGEVAADELVGVLWHGPKPEKVGLKGTTSAHIGATAVSPLSSRIQRVVVGEEE